MSTNTITFANPGEIDPRLITVMGTNVKTSADAIGTFGTGLKYAIAIVLRLGGTVRIHSGMTEMHFRTEPEEIRGKTFGLIYMDTRASDNAGGVLGYTQQLGFTTELGKNWEPWMAFREFYCNALDEKGTIFPARAVCAPAPGRTIVVVDCAELAEVYNTRDKWFLRKMRSAPLAVTPRVELYPNRGDNAFFYRGVKVGDYSVRPKFTYNFLGGLQLTEDRTCHEYYANYVLMAEVLQHVTAPAVLHDLLLHREDIVSMESRLPWEHAYETPSAELISFLKRKRETDRTLLPTKLLSRLAAHLPAETPTGVYLTDLQTESLQRAKEFLGRLGISISARIIVLESIGRNHSGFADGSTLYLPLSVVEDGPKAIATTLLMEWLLAEQGMTNQEAHQWLANKVLAQGEELLNQTV
jgi:hypothetical protein